MAYRNYLRTLTLTAVLVAATALAQTPYDEGQKALREQNWVVAADYFKRAVKEDKETADASMYWRAHALYKAGRKKEAERQLSTLERKYPDSRWVKEARVLQIEHDSAPVLADVADEPGMDEDLRMFALAQLMDRDPERALPLVLDMLKSTGSENTRNDMLFMLGMSDDPRAQEAIAQIARDSKDPELQANAIHMLGISSSEPSIDLLADLYKESDSIQVKQAVIQAYMIGDESGELVEILTGLLKTEESPEMQMDIIRTLGLMDATDELKELYPTLKDNETKAAVLEAYFLAGDTQILRQVLETETDPALRKAAIHGIAMEDDEGAADLLESVYDNATTIDEKKVILESLVMMDDAKELALKIVRTETDVELQREAIHMLGVMEATEEMGALYANIKQMELRKQILESMMIADDIDGLQKVLQSEKNEELRAQAIQMLAVSDDENAAEYLVGLYPQASRTEKKAVIQSMMIMENAEGLIELLKAETDPELKREMLQMLTIMDSEESDRYLFDMLEKKG
ncbi:MAG: HEAT repeat domain-containing protein [Xanthomonadales bacterium]|nr:HEAT repeat domain-containing protein [Xanthomonadales bacterium]